DVGLPPRIRNLREGGTYAYFAVRDILRIVEIDARLRHLDTARHPAGAKVGLTSRICYVHAVGGERVVVEADNERIGSDGPHAVLVFRHGMTTAKLEFNLLRLRRGEAELRAPIGIDLGILGAGNVRGRRFEARV